MVCLPLKPLYAVNIDRLTVTVRSSDDEHDCKVISNMAKENGSTKISQVSFWRHPIKFTDLNIHFKNADDKESFINAVKNLVFYNSDMEKYEFQRIAFKSEIARKWRMIRT